MFGKKSRDPLDQILMDWPTIKGKNEPLTIADATRGIQIFGGTGSGKSSGSGNALAKAFLKHGLGGLNIMCKTW